MASKMTATEVTERINKAQDNLRKLMNTIAKREAKLEKLNAALAQETDRQKKERIQWDIDDEEYALSENKDKIAERTEKVQYWQRKLEEINATNRRLMDMPEQLKELQKEIEAELKEYRTNYRDRMKRDRKEMEWDEFKKKYKGVNYYKVYYQTDEDIAKESEKDAKSYVLDLVSRVQKKVGEITRWELYICGNNLNGRVSGTRGNAKVETILAGGYNIQCLHNRVLVNRI